ncbi:hypothetical protein AXF42_Ash010235 [Apostasia shenzhenica]|uniref:Uncharacterized protein n=1 Tax=Apostasia shenzhenica TaxID=1088818 RepID=A0A2I0A9W2_9ASPA|nr:hypothetical protein AXF42_Ash010235 [Apostasia shenzhenica]
MSRPSATEKLAAIAVAVIAVISPLYIGRRPAGSPDEDEHDGAGAGLSLRPPLLLLVVLLIVGISLSTCLMDQRLARFDPYWIHRAGGSSWGIFIFLLILGFVLKCKPSFGA